jgi:GT2 family glycosyltransferase
MNQPSETDLAVIVVNYNTSDLLRNCVRSIEETAKKISCEIIIVDNHSSDGSTSVIVEEFPHHRAILNPQNAGFSRANNQAIRIARGRYLLLLNSDTVVLPGALDSMLDFMEKHPAAGAVSCRLLNEDGSIQASVSGFSTPWMVFCRLFGLARIVPNGWVRAFLQRRLARFLGSTVRNYLVPYGADRAPVEVENISGSCLLFRREIVQTVGLLDENIFLYLEDMDFCRRIRQAGWKIFYLPSGSIIHLVGRSSDGTFLNFDPRSFQSLFYYYRKHHPARVGLVKAIVMGYCVTRLILLSAAWVFRRNRRGYGEKVRSLWGVLHLSWRWNGRGAQQSIAKIEPI